MITVNRERVDNLSGSVYLGRNTDGNRCYGRIDKLAWVMDLSDDSENAVLSGRLAGLRAGGNYIVRCRPAGKGECSGLYRSVVEIRLKSKSSHHPLMLVIYFAPTNTVRGSVRMEMSPQHYSAEQITGLFIWLGRKGRLGKYLYRGLRQAWVTSIHYALDVKGMKLHDYLIGLAKVHDGEFYDLHGEQEGLRLGSATLVASVYAKVHSPSLSVEERYASPKITLEEAQFERFLRLELRLQPGRQQLKLSQMTSMASLVSRLMFWRREVLQDRWLDPDFAQRLVLMSVPRARATFEPATSLNGRLVSTAPKAARKRVDKVMANYRVALFDSAAIWDQLPVILAKLGLLAQPQYWIYRNRVKWRGSR